VHQHYSLLMWASHDPPPKRIGGALSARQILTNNLACSRRSASLCRKLVLAAPG